MTDDRTVENRDLRQYEFASLPQSAHDQMLGLLTVRMIAEGRLENALDGIGVRRPLIANDKRVDSHDVTLSSVQVASPVRASSASNGNERLMMRSSGPVSPRKCSFAAPSSLLYQASTAYGAVSLFAASRTPIAPHVLSSFTAIPHQPSLHATKS